MRLIKTAVAMYLTRVGNVRLWMSTKDITQDVVTRANSDDYFSGWILKDRPTDFVVVEDRCLSCFDKLQQPQVPVEELRNEEPSPPELQSLITDEQFAVLRAFVESQTSVVGLVGQSSCNLNLDRSTTKEERAQIHQAIRVAFPSLEAKTVIDEARNTSTSFLVYPIGAKSIIDDRASPNGRGGRPARKSVTQRWDKSKPEYLHFTVVKSMLSTAEMMEELARKTGILSTRFEYCGSKDKRAITFQRVSVWRGDQGQFEKLQTSSSSSNDKSGGGSTDNKNKGGRGGSSGGPGMIVRDIRPESMPLRLGDLRGNHFIITLRRGVTVPLSLPASTSSLSSSSSLSSLPSDPSSSSTFYTTPAATPILSTPSADTNSNLSPTRAQVLSTIETVGAKKFLNLFGPQRFGAQMNPEEGKSLLRGDYKRAVLILLLAPQSEEELRLTRFDLSGFLETLQEGISITGDDDGGDNDSWDKYDLDKTTTQPEGASAYLTRVGDWWRQHAISCRAIRASNALAQIQQGVDVLDESMQQQQGNDDEFQEKSDAGENDNSEQSASMFDDTTSITDNYNNNSDNSNSGESKSETRLGRRIEAHLSLISSLLSISNDDNNGDNIALNNNIISFSPKEINRLPFVQSTLLKAWLKQLDEQMKRSDTKSSDNGASDRPGKTTKTTAATINGLDFQRMFSTLPVTLRLLFVNSYQSLLWNNMATRMTRRGSDNDYDILDEAYKPNSMTSIRNIASSSSRGVAVGDLVLVDGAKRPLTAWDIADRNVSLVANNIKPWHADIITSSSDNSKGISSSGDDASDSTDSVTSRTSYNNNGRSGGNGGAYYHVVTEDEAREGIFPIDALIAPLPGDRIYNPASITAAIEADNLDVLIRGDHRDSLFRLPGAYRHVFTSAKNIRYNHSSEARTSNNEGSKCDTCNMDTPPDRWIKVGGDSSDSNNNNNNNNNNSDNNRYDNSVPGGAGTSLSPKDLPHTDSPSPSSSVPSATFSTEVERLWLSGMMERLLGDIKSSGASATTFGRLSSVLADPMRYATSSGVDSRDIITSNVDDEIMSVGNKAEENNGSHSVRSVSTIDDAHTLEDKEEEEGESVQLAFSLCSSAYATTYVSWLLEQAAAAK